MGDSASNIGRAGHNQRHQTVLRQLVLIMQGVWGTLVEMEPQDHLGYSNDYRPDVSGRGLGKARTRLIGDVKFKDPLSSNVEDIGRRGAFVGFGNTAPGTRADVFGLAQRGVKGCEVGKGGRRSLDAGVRTVASGRGQHYMCAGPLRAREGGWGAHLPTRSRSPCPSTARG